MEPNTILSLLEEDDEEERWQQVQSYLNGGGDVNTTDPNDDNNNTFLHVSVHKGDLQLVKLLLEHKADITIKNKRNMTALELAKTLPSHGNSKEIVAVLEYAKLTTYKKRSGTTGVKGKFYESKLLSLILLRALSDSEIEEFYLGTNVGGIGDIDDVCLKYKLKKDSIERFIFIQAKHKDDPSKDRINLVDLRSKSSPFSLAKYFESYLEIKNSFNKKKADNIFFKTDFDKADCVFVLYTPAINNVPEKHITKLTTHNHQIKKILRAPLKSEDIFQITDLNITLEPIIAQRLETLGGLLKSSLLGKNNKTSFLKLMSIYLVKRFHVVLARRVINVSNEKEDSTGKYREGTFQEEFFTTSDHYLSVLREKMFEGLTKEDRDKYRAPSFSFKLPNTFGNIDLHLQGKDDDKKNDRLDSLADDIVVLFKKTPGAYTVKIDKSFYKVKLSGGVAGLVGNLLIHDNDTKLLKFKESIHTVEVNANNLRKFLLDKMKNEFGDESLLYKYRLDVDIDDFPTLFFDGDEQDKTLAQDYQSKLWFFTNQPKEVELEAVIKKEIERQYRLEKRNQFLLKIQSDAIFLKFHATVQRWWMEERSSLFLTTSCNFFSNSKKDIVDSPLLTVLSFVFMKKIKKNEISFNEDAVEVLGINEFLKGTDHLLNIITAECYLTIIKVAQHFERKGTDSVAFLDLDLIIKEDYYDSVEIELEETNFTTLVFIHKKDADTVKLCEIINHICSVSEKKIVVVSESNITDEIQSNCDQNCVMQRDEKNCLSDVVNSDDLAKNLTVVFQGQETTLDRVTNGMTKHLVHSKILWKLINNDAVEIGKTLGNAKYDEVKEYCIPRKLTRGEEYLTETFENIDESVVLVVAEPGMGKSTLLNQLALKTQFSKLTCNHSTTWMVYINLPDYSSEFKRWKTEQIHMDKTEAIRFICKAAINGLEMINSKGKNIKGKNAKGNKSDLNAFKISIHGEDITLKSFVKDERITFDLELFIHYYDQGNVIFLFDGFDEICPHYEKEVCALLKVLTAGYHTSNCELLSPLSILQNTKNLLTKSIPACNCQRTDSTKQRLWVTTRSYSHIKNTLERELGRTAYILKPFSPDEQTFYLKQYLKINFDLSELSEDELMNISGFFDYMLHTLRDENRHIKMVSVPLYVIYVAAVEYFNEQMLNYSYDGRGVNIEESLIEKCKITATVLESYKRVFERQYKVNQLITISQNPLHLYITAEYFLNHIKNEEKIPVDEESVFSKWDVSAKSFSLFEYYLEIKFKKIRFEEKKDIDISKPDNDMTFQKDWKDFIELHKKIALCAIYEDDILLKSQIIKESELKSIHDIITRIDSGEEKNGVVDRVVDNVPRFVHLVFAEYFSVEYICDVLKNVLASTAEDEIHDTLWDFLINIVLYKGTGGVRTFFDRKLKDDSNLLELLSSEHNKKHMFTALIKQGKDNGVVPGGFNSSFKVHKTCLNIAVEESLFNVQDYIFESIKFSLNDDNFSEFSKTIANSLLLVSAIGMNNDSLIERIRDCINDRDKFLHLFIPDFVTNILPFKITLASLENFSFLKGLLPQLASLNVDNITLTPNTRSAFSDYINFLWDLIMDK